MLEEAKKEIEFSGVKNEIREQKMKIQVQTIDKNKIEEVYIKISCQELCYQSSQ